MHSVFAHAGEEVVYALVPALLIVFFVQLVKWRKAGREQDEDVGDTRQREGPDDDEAG